MSRPSTSSRLNPNTIWVRSLVPNEKKSATSAMSSPRTAARGVSIIVPIVTSIARRPSGQDRLDLLLDPPSDQRELGPGDDERHHDLDDRVGRRRRPRSAAASTSARTCIL